MRERLREQTKDVFNIVTDDEAWLYNYDLEEKQQSTEWCFQNEYSPTTVRRRRSVGKTMVESFF